MGKPWTELLATSQVQFMNEIIAQVPSEHGARDSFIEIIQQLADAPAKPEFAYVMVKGDQGDVTGTNEEEVARIVAIDEANYVIDVVNMKWIVNSNPKSDSSIVEERP